MLITSYDCIGKECAPVYGKGPHGPQVRMRSACANLRQGYEKGWDYTRQRANDSILVPEVRMVRRSA